MHKDNKTMAFATETKIKTIELAFMLYNP